MVALPALVAPDIDEFGRAVGEIQRALGDHFAPAQDGRRFASDTVGDVLSWFEGQGISAIEALSAGLPAVLSDVDGLRNLRDMGVPAAWCGTDAASLSDTIRRVISQPPVGTLERMRETFSPTTRVPALADVYRRVARS